MTSFSSFIGLTSFLTSSSYTSISIIFYYRTMKDSLSSLIQINKRALFTQKEIYKRIIFYLMGFLYIISFDSTINYIYLTAGINGIFYLCILNMHLFINKNQNQMLLQTLFFFLAIKLTYSICNKYIIALLFLCSNFFLIMSPIDKLRKGILLNNKIYFDIENILIEITIYLLWLIYSSIEGFLCFFFICIINLFVWICMLFGHQVVAGEIGTNSKIYHFLIMVFFIRNQFRNKVETSNI